LKYYTFIHLIYCF